MKVFRDQFFESEETEVNRDQHLTSEEGPTRKFCHLKYLGKKLKKGSAKGVKHSGKGGNRVQSDPSYTKPF